MGKMTLVPVLFANGLVEHVLKCLIKNQKNSQSGQDSAHSFHSSHRVKREHSTQNSETAEDRAYLRN